MSVLQGIIARFIELAQTIFNSVFGGVDFAVLWRWLPGDIGAAAMSFIAVLFGLAIIKGVRNFLPF